MLSSAFHMLSVNVNYLGMLFNLCLIWNPMLFSFLIYNGLMFSVKL